MESNLFIYFKAFLEQDPAPIVLCNPDHIIIYMNPSAIRQYAGQGGAALVGQSLLACHNPHSGDIIRGFLDRLASSAAHSMIYEARNDNENKDVYFVALRDDAGRLIGYYEKHVKRSRETAPLHAFVD